MLVRKLGVKGYALCGICLLLPSLKKPFGTVDKNVGKAYDENRNKGPVGKATTGIRIAAAK